MGKKHEEPEPPPIDWPPCMNQWREDWDIRRAAAIRRAYGHTNALDGTTGDIRAIARHFNLHHITVEKILRTEAVIGMERLVGDARPKTTQDKIRENLEAMRSGKKLLPHGDVPMD